MQTWGAGLEIDLMIWLLSKPSESALVHDLFQRNQWTFERGRIPGAERSGGFVLNQKWFTMKEEFEKLGLSLPMGFGPKEYPDPSAVKYNNG